MNRVVVTGIGSFLLAMSLSGRVFRDETGRVLEAELLSATETEAMLRIERTGKVYRLKIAVFSEADREYIVKRRLEIQAESGERDAGAARKARMIWGAREVVAFVNESKGRQVGNGQCWTLADEAFKKAGIKRPGKEIRVWGRLVDWENEPVLPGDILELRSAQFAGGMASGPEHTAVVIKAERRPGVMVVHHQNWGAAGKKVSQATFDLSALEEGEAMVYRYEGG